MREPYWLVYSTRGRRARDRVRLLWCAVGLFWVTCILLGALAARLS